MQNTLPNQQSEQHTWWQALKDLDFLSSFFSWFFMLLTRLSEPLMLLSTLYVVAETGVPPIASPALHNLAIGIMITAPELILPGAFVVAARAPQYARWLLAVCCAFVALTLITLVSLFVWHFTGQALAWLMCARCAAAVGYSILMRVMNHSQRVNQTVQAIPVPDVQVFVQEIRENIDHLQRENSEQLQRIHASTERQIADQLQRTFTEFRGYQQRAERAQKPAQFERILYVEQSAICDEIAPIFESNSVCEFVEFGHARIPDEVAREADGQSEIAPQFPPQIAPNLTLLSPSKETAKGPYLMSYEEAAEYTGLSVRTLKSKVNSSEIETSNSGKLKIKSLEKFRRKSV